LLTREFNVSARRIEGPELCSLDPSLKPGLAGAFLYETDTMLRPERLCREWRERLMCRGVRFVESCEVLSAEKEADGIECVITSKGPMTADGYVLATGARSGQLGHLFGCYLPIQPGKGYSVTMPRPAICPSYPMLFPEHRVGVTPFQEGYRLGSMMEFVGFDEQIPSSRVKQLKRSAEPYLKQPHTDGQSETWYGWRPMTWDSLPAIGPASGLRNAYVATGHNMLGLSMAPATGKMIAAMIAGKGPELDPSPFDPARFARA
jgi:D-amino-acid dehydrogenase